MGLKQNLDNLFGKFYAGQFSPEAWMEVLGGRKIVEASTETGTLVLDNGMVLQFDKENDDCCSWVELSVLRTTGENVITGVEITDNEDETGGEGPYWAKITVLTDDGPVDIAEQTGDASNGYYLHGFALGVKMVHPPRDL